MCALHCCVCDVLRHRHLTWLRRRFPNQKVGLIWDMAPGHTDRRVMEHISKARLQGWLKVGLIPGGSTSITQPCDLVANAPLKKKMKCWHSRWKNQKLVDLQSSKGHVKLKLPRTELVRGSEEAIRDFNKAQMGKPTVRDCFNKCGLNPFNCDEELHDNHTKSFMQNRIHRSLLENQMAVDLK
mmetsp:Transcript_3296/g.5269  ORF Transcript_3296/g.5269 Transcript_3296/m.5269 type:complete len:183 (-) Transcript_3296:82-630(-)